MTNGSAARVGPVAKQVDQPSRSFRQNWCFDLATPTELNRLRD